MRPEDLLRLRRELATIRTRIEELCGTIQEHSKAINAAEQSNRNKSAQPTNTVVSTSPDKSFIAEVRPNDPKGQAIQRSIRLATWFAACSTFAAFVAASIYAGIAYREMSLLKTANRQAKNQWEAEYRPWVSVESISLDDGSLKFSPTQGGYEVSYTFSAVLRNYGLTPAQREFETFKPTFGLHLSPDWRKSTFCDDAEQYLTTTGKQGRGLEQVIFQNTTQERRNQKGSFPFLGGMPHIFIEGCIVYKGARDETTYHETRFVFQAIPASSDAKHPRPSSYPPGLSYPPIGGFSLIEIKAN